MSETEREIGPAEPQSGPQAATEDHGARSAGALADALLTAWEAHVLEGGPAPTIEGARKVLQFSIMTELYRSSSGAAPAYRTHLCDCAQAMRSDWLFAIVLRGGTETAEERAAFATMEAWGDGRKTETAR